MTPTKETAEALTKAERCALLCRSYLAANAFDHARRCADEAKAHWIKVEWVQQ